MEKKGGEGIVLLLIMIAITTLLIISAPPVLGLPTFLGYVWNASDGTPANDRIMLMWLSINNKSTNETGIIGPNGDRHEDNGYLIDCKNPNNGDPMHECQEGDVVSLEVLEDDSLYTTQTITVTVTAQMLIDNLTDLVNVTLIKNAAPNITIISPADMTQVAGILVINASVVNNSGFGIDATQYSIGNVSGNFTKEGEPGWSDLYRQESTDYYNDTLNTSRFANGNYLLYAKSNNSKGKESDSWSNITIKNAQDLMVNSSSISFSNNTPYEGQNITINTTIYNIGTIDVANGIVQFYTGSMIPANQIGGNQSVNIAAQNSTEVSITYLATVGYNNITVIADPPVDTNGSIDELNESNNIASSGFTVSAYQIIYGNVSGRLTLSDNTFLNMVFWDVANTTDSNIYVCDSDTTIHFDSLQALSRSKTGTFEGNDFAELDSILGISGSADNINATYTVAGNPRETASFTLFRETISNVPIVNSTNTSDFITGILWDTYDDTTDGEYDMAEHENVVFVTKVNKNKQGMYGYADYEIQIPGHLRLYQNNTLDTVSFYIEIK